MRIMSWNNLVSLSVSSNESPYAAAFPAIALFADWNMKMLIPTSGSAAVCLKRVAEAQFFVPRSQRRTSGAI